MSSTFDIRHSTFPPRRGISLMEVLISMFILSVGLLGLAALIPVGRFAIVETGKADRSGACGRAMLREVKVQRMLDPYYVYNPDPKLCVYRWDPSVALNGQSFVIDPLFWAKNGAKPVPAGVAAPKVSIPRITLNSPASQPGVLLNAMSPTEAEARGLFAWHDDLLFDMPDDATQRPSQLFQQGTAQTTTFAPGAYASYTGYYSCLLTVTPAVGDVIGTQPLVVTGAPQEAMARRSVYSVSVAVCYRRDLDPAMEKAADATFLGGNGVGGGSVQLNPPLELKENQWILLCGVKPNPMGGTVPFCKWYRVVAVGTIGPPGPSQVQYVSLAGPDWDATLNTILVQIDGVIAVYTTTVELDSPPLWMKTY